MLTKEDLYLLRKYLGLTLQDVATRMLCTRATLSNIELGKSTHPMTMLFYEKTLTEILAKNPDGPTTYVAYLEDVIAMYKTSLTKYQLSTDEGLQKYLANDIYVTEEAFHKVHEASMTDFKTL